MTDFAAKARVRRVTALEQLQSRRQMRSGAAGNLAGQIGGLPCEAEFRSSRAGAQVFMLTN